MKKFRQIWARCQIVKESCNSPVKKVNKVQLHRQLGLDKENCQPNRRNKVSLAAQLGPWTDTQDVLKRQVNKVVAEQPDKSRDDAITSFVLRSIVQR